MHVVTCPHCGRQSRVPRPVSERKIRCRCGKVFIGTSRLTHSASPSSGVEESPSPPGGGSPLDAPSPPPVVPASPHAAHPIARRRPRPSSLPLVIVIVCVLGSMAAAILGWYLYSYPYREHRVGGAVVISGRMTDGEFDRKLAEYIRKNPPAAVRAKAPGVRDEGASSQPGPGASTGPVERRVGPKPVAIPAGDPKVSVQVDPRSPDANDQNTWGHLVGSLQNGYDRPLKSVEVLVFVEDTQGRRRGPFRTTCRYVPARGSAKFSVKFEDLTRRQIGKVEAVAVSPVKAGADVACWNIEFTREDAERLRGKIVLTGRTFNTTDHLLTDVVILCDFYTGDGILVFSKPAKMRYGTRLKPGEAGFFTVEFDSTGTPAELIQEFQARLWAKIAR